MSFIESLRSQNVFLLITSAIGLLTVFYCSYLITRVLLSIFVLPGKPLSTFGPRGSWALITGASDGIGKEYALQLAAAGYNLVLVSRTQSKLDALSTTITGAHPAIQIRTFAMDFSLPSPEPYTFLSTLITPLDLSILINNVGVSHSIPVPFSSTTESELSAIITTNCTATLRVTQLVLPGMLSRKRGLILTMGSAGGLLPTPLLATYSGSKAFLQQWSSALAAELAPHGITVHLVHSYLVTSAMSKIRRTSLLVPSERAFVKSVLAKIGRRGGSIGYAYSGSPYWSHALLLAGMLGVFGPYGSFLLGQNREMHEQIRKRALARAERNKGKKAA